LKLAEVLPEFREQLPVQGIPQVALLVVPVAALVRELEEAYKFEELLQGLPFFH
jgi:hypothetical protein